MIRNSKKVGISTIDRAILQSNNNCVQVLRQSGAGKWPSKSKRGSFENRLPNILRMYARQWHSMRDLRAG